MKIRVFAFSLAIICLFSSIIPLNVKAASISAEAVSVRYEVSNTDNSYTAYSHANIVSSSPNIACFGSLDPEEPYMHMIFVPIDSEGNYLSSSSYLPSISTSTDTTNPNYSGSAWGGTRSLSNYNAISLTLRLNGFVPSQYWTYELLSFAGPSMDFLDFQWVMQFEGNTYLDKSLRAAVERVINGDYQPDYDYDPDDGFEIPIPDPDDWIPDYGNIPVPEVTYLGTHGLYNQWTDFTCDNATPDYYVEMRGCFYTPNELNFETKGMITYLYYDSLLFDNWGGSRNNRYFIRVDDLVKAQSSHIDVEDAALDSFHAFKAAFPWSSIINNTPSSEASKVITRGVIDKYETDYFPAMGAYNGCDFYIRYFTFDNGEIRYGRWLHGRSNVPKSGDRVGGDGDDWEDEPDDSPDGVEDIPDDPDIIPWPDIDDDPDDGLIPDIDPDGGILSNIIRWINSILVLVRSVANTTSSFVSTSYSSMGQFPEAIGRVFTFLPNYCINAIAASILIAILLRVLKR